MQKITQWAAAAALGLGLGLSAAAQAAPHNAKTSLDWQGLYVGTLPCASCPGFYTEVQLLGKRSYRISESAEHQGEFSTWVKRGRFAWNAKGNSIRMGQGSEQRQYLVQEHALEQLAVDGSRITGDLAPLYRLAQAQRFSDAAGQMLVLVASVQHDAAAQTVQFDGRENLSAPKAAGQRSLAAHYTLQCRAKTYEMGALQYFDALNGQGKPLKLTGQSSEPIALGKADSRMQQVFAHYCGQK
jgi:uncharacterized lipoprotein NlpE involved in copper resistance